MVSRPGPLNFYGAKLIKFLISVPVTCVKGNIYKLIFKNKALCRLKKVYDRLYAIEEEDPTGAGRATINNNAWLVMDKLLYQNNKRMCKILEILFLFISTVSHELYPKEI